jgi:predicted CopG family antitoxin
MRKTKQMSEKTFDRLLKRKKPDQSYNDVIDEVLNVTKKEKPKRESIVQNTVKKLRKNEPNDKKQISISEQIFERLLRRKKHHSQSFHELLDELLNMTEKIESEGVNINGRTDIDIKERI